MAAAGVTLVATEIMATGVNLVATGLVTAGVCWRGLVAALEIATICSCGSVGSIGSACGCVGSACWCVGSACGSVGISNQDIQQPPRYPAATKVLDSTIPQTTTTSVTSKLPSTTANSSCMNISRS